MQSDPGLLVENITFFEGTNKMIFQAKKLQRTQE